MNKLHAVLQRRSAVFSAGAKATPKEHRNEQGFTMVELIIVILGILAAITMGALNLNSSKGKSLYLGMASMAHASEVFDASLGAYPTVYAALFDPTYGQSATDNTSGVSLATTWDGPYGKARPISTAGILMLNNIATGITVTYAPLTKGGAGSLPNGLNYQYAIVANNVPKNIATQAVDACNGAQNSSGNGDCVLVAGTGTDQVYYIFAQNNNGPY